MNKIKGNLLGVFSILLWSSLALFSIHTFNIPAFQLVSMSFFIAFFIGFILLKKQNIKFKKAFIFPLKVWFVGVIGLFGYHFFYFLAIKNAPAVEANLINYLWPLLIVVFSSFLPNEKLKWYHIVGTVLGLLGAYFLVSKGQGFNFKSEFLLGYLYALIAAFIWSSYSVISRTFDNVPTYAVSAFCLVTAILSLICHLIFEQTVIPNVKELFAIVALGLGPVGGAFYLWDYAVKNADIKLLGSISYFTPLLSTLILVVFSYASFTFYISLACILIILGSFISSFEYIKLIKNMFLDLNQGKK